MSAQTGNAEATEDPVQQVADFLQANPDFFQHNPELLTGLELSHGAHGTVSLVERQVRALRQELTEQKQQLARFVEVARENDLLSQRMHTLTLALLNAVSFDEVVNVLEDKLHNDFQADAVELHLFTQAESDGDANPDLDGFRPFLRHGKPRCGRLPKAQLSYLFGTQAGDIGSTALIPLEEEGVLGLLAIGSHDAQRFHPGMGTEYLRRLGDIVSKTLEVVSEPGF